MQAPNPNILAKRVRMPHMRAIVAVPKGGERTSLLIRKR